MVEDENERVGRVGVDLCKEKCGSRCTRLAWCLRRGAEKNNELLYYGSMKLLYYGS
jgi:hypothetical protein